MPLSSHVPDLPALELLLDVAATGSIGAAARVHSITQQAASARLRTLEGLVGLTLLDRQARGSRLTDAGTAVAAWAERVVAAAVELDDAVAALRHQGSARLRVAASMTIAEHLVPRWLVTLRTRFPGGPSGPAVTLTATNSDEVVRLVRGGSADLGFVEGPQAPSGLRAQVITQDRLVLVVSGEHPWAHRTRAIGARELAGTSLVSRESGSGTRSAFEAAIVGALGAGARLSEPVAEFGTATAVREAVRAGLAPAVLSDLSVADDLASGRLVAVRTAGLDLRRDLRAVWVGGESLPPGPARDLIAIVRSPRG